MKRGVGSLRKRTRASVWRGRESHDAAGAGYRRLLVPGAVQVVESAQAAARDEAEGNYWRCVRKKGRRVGSNKEKNADEVTRERVGGLGVQMRERRSCELEAGWSPWFLAGLYDDGTGLVWPPSARRSVCWVGPLAAGPHRGPPVADA